MASRATDEKPPISEMTLQERGTIPQMSQANPQTAEMETQMTEAIPPKLRAFGEIQQKERFRQNRKLCDRHMENGKTNQQL